MKYGMFIRDEKMIAGIKSPSGFYSFMPRNGRMNCG
jgi:hypothetical protein